MPEKDIAEKTLESYNDVFADIVNVLLFGGKRIVKENALTDAQPFSQYKADDGGIRNQERDVAKYWKEGEIRLSLLGFENQSVPDKNMPLRVISYDGAAYRSQLAKNSKNFYPVVTMILYFGTKQKWKTSKNLKHLLSIPEGLEKFVSDYKIHVFEIAWLSDEIINKFTSDFKLVALYLRTQRLGKFDKWPTKKLKHVHEILDLLRVISSDNMIMQFEDAIIHDNKIKRGIAMDSLFTKWWKEGKAEGKSEAEANITTLFSKLFELGRAADVERASKDNDYLQKLKTEFLVPENA